MAPVVRALRAGGWCEALVVATGQHRDLLDTALADVGLAPDLD
ncbi:MAG: hypothetical protein RL562_2630, partial [Planctomycetota bacterium]